MDFIMIIQCWGPLLSARLASESFDPQDEQFWARIEPKFVFVYFFLLGSPIIGYSPEVNVFEVRFVWSFQGYPSYPIPPNLARPVKYPNTDK